MNKQYTNPLPPAGDPRFTNAIYELARRSHRAIDLAVQDLDVTNTPGYKAYKALLESQEKARATLSNPDLVSKLTPNQVRTLQFIAN